MCKISIRYANVSELTNIYSIWDYKTWFFWMTSGGIEVKVESKSNSSKITRKGPEHRQLGLSFFCRINFKQMSYMFLPWLSFYRLGQLLRFLDQLTRSWRSWINNSNRIDIASVIPGPCINSAKLGIVLKVSLSILSEFKQITFIPPEITRKLKFTRIKIKWFVQIHVK